VCAEGIQRDADVVIAGVADEKRPRMRAAILPGDGVMSLHPAGSEHPLERVWLHDGREADFVVDAVDDRRRDDGCRQEKVQHGYEVARLRGCEVTPQPRDLVTIHWLHAAILFPNLPSHDVATSW